MKLLHVGILLSLLTTTSLSQAADLLSVYHDAVTNSPILATDLNTALATGEGVWVNTGTLLPQVVGTAAASTNQTNAQNVSASYNSTAYGMTITQQIFNYTDLANTKGAQYNKQAAMNTYISQKQQFILNVAEAYFNVINAQYDVDLAQSQYDFLKKTLDQAEAKFRVGSVTYTDVAQARANLQSAYATLVSSQNTLAINNQNLQVYTGKPETNLAILSTNKQLPLTTPDPDNVDAWVKIAEAKNPQLLAQEATEKAALASVHASVGQQLPSVFVEASYQKINYNSTVPSIVSFSSQSLTKSLELGLNWNIFSSGETMSQTLSAADQYVSQENTSLNLYRQTQSQTVQDYLNIISNISQIQAYQQAEIAANASLKQFADKYRVGTATIVDVLNQVQSLYQARYNLSAAYNQYIESVLSLKADVGTLSEQDLAHFNQYLQVPTDNTKMTFINS